MSKCDFNKLASHFYAEITFRHLIFVAAHSLNMILHIKTMYFLFGYTMKIL